MLRLGKERFPSSLRFLIVILPLFWNSITFGDAHRLDQRDILMSEITQL
jgi:hypothetical protein